MGEATIAEGWGKYKGECNIMRDPYDLEPTNYLNYYRKKDGGKSTTVEKKALRNQSQMSMMNWGGMNMEWMAR